MTSFHLLLCLIITSVYGRVAVIETNLNKIHDDSKINSIKIEDHDDVTNDGLTVIPVANKLCHEDEDNNIVSDIKPCDDTIKIDNGTALILTPLIEQGRVEEARNACSVDRSLFLGIESYSGFLTVNSTYKSHLFFWYFPSFAKPTNETPPWIIWLQGGPGASSLAGLFDEIGPFSANDKTLKFNPHTWLMNHSLVFIDNPVGTGYSFTEHKDGYAHDMATYGKHLHIAVNQLVQLFPELRVAPLYVAGESYAGKYVPALGMEIHKHMDAPSTHLNFKGMILGNAYIEPGMITQLARTFYNFGMLEQEQLEIIQPLVDAFQADVASNRSIEAKDKWSKLVALLLSLSSQAQAYNFLADDLSLGKFIPFLFQPEIKRALHVGDIKFSFINTTVNSQLAPDFLSSSKPLFEELLNTYRVLVYCGHLDQMLPCTMTSERLRKWKWNESKHFIESWRLPFYLDTKLAGYHKTGGNLTWAVVRGAGHMVPMDQPASSQLLISKWTHRQPLTFKLNPLSFMTHPHFLRNYVQEMVSNTRNQTNNSTSEVKNQTNSTSDAKNQTNNGTSDAKTLVKTSEKIDIVKTNLSSENSTIVKRNENIDSSISDAKNESSENNLIDTTNQTNDTGDQTILVYM